MLRKIIATLCITVIAAVSAKADGYRVSLVTCYPGQIVYELYGHTAIRIKNGNMDKAYNFGMFSFSKPNFIYRFVKGETDYALAGYPFIYFMPEYIERNSKVVEQVLNLSQRQAEELYQQLEWLSLPENREYRYNYVLDNCATRPRDMIEKVTGGIEYPQPADTTLTFRRMMRSYSTNYPWYQFGIDLALGPGIDYRLDTREQMFAPIYLMDAFQKAKFTDENGNKVPLVKEKIVLYDGSESPVLPPTPWYISPLFAAFVMLAIALGLTIRDLKTKKISRWFDFLWFMLAGLAGCLIFFLVFVSVHEATSPNYLAFWLNPFCLIVPALIFIKKLRKWLYFYHFINFAVVLILLAVWPLLPQSANTAFFPLMACSIIRSANYVYIEKCARKSR